jgi:glycine/D-amino acid oxidase-like deaminating enzyme
MPIFLFIAAAALIAGGVETLDLAKKSKARQDARRKQEFEAEILQREIDLQQLRDEARRRGLDPEAVVAGYRSLADGTLSVEEVLRALELGA